MKAIAVFPGKANSVHRAELSKPSLDAIPNGRGVLVKVVRVGVDSTDREINAAAYGSAPDGDDFLVIGHESFGQPEAVGPNVTELCPGDYVVATPKMAEGLRMTITTAMAATAHKYGNLYCVLCISYGPIPT